MNILIDIGHPAHVHLFKNFARRMQERGHKILFTARDKEYEIYLLSKYGFDFKSFGKHYKTLKGKLWGLCKFNIQLLAVALKFKPDMFVSHGSPYAAQVSWLLRKPHISLEDTGNMEQIRIYRPFTNVILAPDVLKKQLGPKEIRYNGYHELAYLLPDYFQPDGSIYQLLGIPAGQRYCILRFVSWWATHDKGQSGLTYQYKKDLVAELSKHIKVFISSEKELDPEFASYQIKIPPEKMHDALAFADLYIGEGATMASEAAVLGTPAIYINSISGGYTEDQERFGLTFNFRTCSGVKEKALDIVCNKNSKEEWQKRRFAMLSSKIDVTAFISWFVENYPQSEDTVRKTRDYMETFKVVSNNGERKQKNKSKHKSQHNVQNNVQNNGQNNGQNKLENSED